MARDRARRSRPGRDQNQEHLAVQYQRLKPRIGHGRALGAVNYFVRRDPERATKRLLAKLQALGRHVTLQPAAA